MWKLFWPVLVLAATASFGRAAEQIRKGCNDRPLLAEPCQTTTIKLEDMRGMNQKALARRLNGAAIERLSWTSSVDGIAVHEYTVAIAEFDDQGRAWNARQVEAVKAAVSQVLSRKNALIVTFIHGWKNNCEACNGNLACFRESLALLAANEVSLAKLISAFTQQPSAPREVIGVYIGWRGGTAQVEPAKTMSLFGRKQVAERIGSSRGGDVTNLLSWLNAQRTVQPPHDRSQLGNMMAFIGHSLGADLLFGTVANTLDAQIATMPGGHLGATPFGDVLVLINPAFEASAYGRFADYATQTWAHRQPPLMLTIQARDDGPTGKVFPVTRSLSTLGQSSGRDDYDAMLKGLGHYPPFFTHDLGLPSDPLATAQTLSAMTSMPLPRDSPQDQLEAVVREMGKPLAQEKCACNGTRATDQALKILGDSIVHDVLASGPPMDLHLGSPLVGKLSQLRPCGTPNLDSPLMVIRADPAVVKGHSGITKLELFDFLANFILRTHELRNPSLFELLRNAMLARRMDATIGMMAAPPALLACR